MFIGDQLIVRKSKNMQNSRNEVTPELLVIECKLIFPTKVI